MKIHTRKVEQTDNVATGVQARKARQKAGKSLRSVATALGHSAAYISDLELGRRAWSEPLLRRYEVALKQ